MTHSIKGFSMSRSAARNTEARRVRSLWNRRRRARGSERSLQIEALESRQLLAIDFGSAAMGGTYAYDWRDGALSDPTEGAPVDVAAEFLTASPNVIGLASFDAADFTVSSVVPSAKSGVQTVHWNQMANGLAIRYATVAVGVAADGRILTTGGSPFDGEIPEGAPVPALSVEDAMTRLAGSFGWSLDEAPGVIRQDSDAARSTVLTPGSVAMAPITAQLEYLPIGDDLDLTWRINVQTIDTNHWYDISVSAMDGSVLDVADWMSSAQYEVYAAPKESPYDGGRTIEVNPNSLSASPYGWHDTNGAVGAESTLTVGNNVVAYADRDGDNAPDAGSQPDGGAGLDFTGALVPINFALEPIGYRNAAVVNLFYWNNFIHDALYAYGFNEASGNFQTNNYGNGGLGGDAVNAEAQDKADLGFRNNANFATPPDGSKPRMQMYIWNGATPELDGDLDSEIIIHEYAHGLSNRLTGGPADSNALNAPESGSMGEGWSDFVAVMLTQQATDAANTGRGIVNYSLNQPDAATGLRSHAYTYNMAINPLTYADVPFRSVPHAVGVVWASMLWDLNWALIEGSALDPAIGTAGLGFDADTVNGNGGNNLALQLVIDAMKLQPANPTFVQARDAILAADQAQTGGQYQGTIWQVFARRGLGQSADAGSAWSTADGTAATNFPLIITGAAAGGNGANNGTADAFRIVRNGANIEVWADGSLAQTVPAASVTEILVNGSGDDDELLVDLSGGLLGKPITFNGGGQTTGDLLRVIGDRASGGAYTPSTTTNGDGTVTVGGDTIGFTGLEPVEISALPSFVFTTPNSDDNILIDGALASGGESSVRVSGTSGGIGFEQLIAFNIGVLTVNTGTNDAGLPIDNVTVAVAGPVLGVPSVVLFTGNGNDSVSILATPAGTVTLVDTQTGSGDFVTVGRLAIAAPGTGSLAGLGGNVVLDDAGGVLDIAIDNGASAANTDWMVRSSAASRTRVAVFGIPGTIDFSNFAGDDVSIQGGSGDDTFFIDFAMGNPLPYARLDLNGGGQVTGDRLQLDNGTFTQVTHTFTNENDGTVRVDDATPNNDLLRYFGFEPIIDNLNVANRVFTFSSAAPNATLAASPVLPATHSRLDSSVNEMVDFTTPTASLTVNFAPGDNYFYVQSLAGNYTTPTSTINGNGSGDDVLIEATGPGTWTFNGGNGSNRLSLSLVAGDLDNLPGRVFFNGGAGADVLVVSDHNQAVGDVYVLTSSTIDRAGWGGVTYDGFVNAVSLYTGDGSDVIVVTSTTASGSTTVFGQDGSDMFTIDGSQLGGVNAFRGGAQNDAFTVWITAAGGITGTSVLLDGESHDAGDRDIAHINDSFGLTANATFDYGTGTMVTASGLGTTVSMDRMERIAFFGSPANDDSIVVNGSTGDDLITVAPQGTDRALVFFNTSADASGPFNGPPESFATRLPGIEGGGSRADLLLWGLSSWSGLTVGDAGGVLNRLYIYGESDNGLSSGGPHDWFGFGAGMILPAVGAGNAFDAISVSDTGTWVNGFAVNYGNTAFAQAVPATQPAVVINSGFEANPTATGGTDVADDIWVTLSPNYRFKVNGGDPDPATTAIVPPDGDRVNLWSAGTILNVHSDKASPPNVTIDFADDGALPFGWTSIENLLLDVNGGTVNLLGDNNFTTDQTDNFVVAGRNVDDFAGDGGYQEMDLRINGSGPLLINNFQFLNAYGGNLVDTLDVRPYADNTPRGWGVSAMFDEGAPDQTDGGQADLIIYRTSLYGGAVSENIVVQPSGPESGQIRVTNASFGTPVVNIDYVSNLDIIVHDDDGFLSDTDTLTLRGTTADAPLTSGQDRFEVDMLAAGGVATPKITVTDLNPPAALPLLYRVRDLINIRHVRIETLSGVDEARVRTDGTTSFFVDGGDPIGVMQGPGDLLDVTTDAAPISFLPGPESDEGTVAVLGDRPVSFDHLEALLVDGVLYVRPDGSEANNAMATATVLGSEREIALLNRTLHGTHGTAGGISGTTTSDVDFYRLTANKTGYVIVNALFSHAAGDVDMRIRDSAGNVIASSMSVTDNETIILPIVAQQVYFVEVFSFDSKPTTYALEIEQFAAGAPTAIDLDDPDDSGRSSLDNVTRLGTPTLYIHADLGAFADFGIPILTAAQAAAGTTAGAAVELFRNGVSIGFANSVGGLPNLFSFVPTAAQLALGTPIGPATSPPVAADAMGYLNLMSAAVRVFDAAATTVSGRAANSARMSLVYDPNTPNASLITAEMLDASDSGVIGDGVTNINQPAFWGIAEANTRIRIYAQRVGGLPELVGEGAVGSDLTDVAVAGQIIGGVAVAGLPNDGLGLWEITVEPLRDGNYSFRFTVEDLAGNVTSPAAGPVVGGGGAIGIDTMAPQRPTIDLTDVDDTGYSDKDNVSIGDPTQGNGILDYRISAEPGSTVYVKDGEVVIDSFTFTLAFDMTDGVADGFGVRTINFVVNAGVFGIPAQGPHPLSTESFDLAGNRSHQSEELLTTVDFTPPAATAAPDLAADSDTGISDSDNVTAIRKLVMVGSGEANAILRVFATNVNSGAVQRVGIGSVQSDESDGAPTNGTGIWELTLEPLDDGVYDLRTVVEDQAGNISPSSAPLRVEIDTVVPNTAFLDMFEADDGGRHNDDNVTNVAAPRFTATTEDPNAAFHTTLFPAGPHLRYRVYDRGEGVAEALLFDSAFVPGNFVSTGALALADGHHNLKLEVEDRAGNISADYLMTVVIDTVAPPVTITGIASRDTGVTGNAATLADRVTSDIEPTFAGRAEADSIVRLYVDGKEGIDNDNNVINAPGEFALTVAQPIDGDNALANGQWRTSFVRNLNHPSFFDLDGVREVLATAEDLAGNVSAPQVLDIFIDTRGPQVTDIRIDGSPAFNLFDPKPTAGPTPLANALRISVRDLAARSNQDANFLYTALEAGVAVNPGNFTLIGDATGAVVVNSITFIGNPVADNAAATGSIILGFAKPLADDRFTLTITDRVVDPVGNALDGETNTAQPTGTPVFPSGDGRPGKDLVARFTIDSRPEIGTWAGGTMWIDTNGNGYFDPKNVDLTNRDIVYAMGLVTDDVFAGNFSPTAASMADGFDKLAAFGFVGGAFRWLIDTDNDGRPDVIKVDPTAVNGLPIAGNFDGIASNGDEVGIFDGDTWYFDTDHDFEVGDVGGSFSLSTSMRGYPIVGDFNGDGLDDLGTWTDDRFRLDLAAGPGPLTWDGTADSTFRFGFIGVRERPVAADMNRDGYADLGLWTPDREGVPSTESSEWFFLVSNGAPVSSRIRFDAPMGTSVVDYHPYPFGNDMYFQMGDQYALPVVGNFDPPLDPNRVDPVGNLQFNTRNVYDVDGDGRATTRDVIVLAREVAQEGGHSLVGSAASAPYVDVDQDGRLSTSDLIEELRFVASLNRGHAERESSEDNELQSRVDWYFSDLATQKQRKNGIDASLLEVLAIDQAVSAQDRTHLLP
ncbi:MAG: hypothetical protein FJ297_06700 [Planctomycetes bacterium]|nr:hypothetical protein [Planctomycetota bacterium]